MNEWVPVTERMPDKSGRYLCAIKHGNKSECISLVFDFAKDLYEVNKIDFEHKKGDSGFYGYDSECGYYIAYYVVAWMQLPEPYKIRKEG